MQAADIIHFWFEEIDSKLWFKKDDSFDEELRQRFSEIHCKASKGEIFSWRDSPEGRLAEIIILDQFSRNMFRGSPQAFAYDGMALTLAQEAVSRGFDQQLPIERRAFLYMPYMHSESLLVHEEAVRLFAQEGLEYSYKFEIAHKEIIERFGRYPHRNQILGRDSTPDELQFMKEHSGF